MTCDKDVLNATCLGGFTQSENTKKAGKSRKKFYTGEDITLFHYFFLQLSFFFFARIYFNFTFNSLYVTFHGVIQFSYTSLIHFSYTSIIHFHIHLYQNIT